MSYVELPLILTDELYLSCLSLAQNSKGEIERYGSRLVKDGYYLGEGGYNRAIVHPSFPKLDRPIYQGYSNHAEIEALCAALMAGYDVEGSEIYVGGYFPNERSGLLFLQHQFTCLKCPPILARYGVTTINVPSPYGWVPRTMEEAMEDAREFKAGGTHQSRLASVIGIWTIANLPALQ